LINNNTDLVELNEKIKELDSKIEAMDKKLLKKKIGIAFVNKYFYMYSIARYISVLSDLLVKTGKYDVYLINDQATDIDYHYNKKIKRIIKTNDEETIKEIDEENDIDIYILNNDLSERIDIYKSLGKKVVGIFHGVYLSSIYDKQTLIYRSWTKFANYDSFIHIIPDDYYVYKKFGFTNTIYIPNINTFDSTKIPSSDLIFKNLLIVGRFNVEIKGLKYGLLAMAEILKKVPDAKLTILGLNPPEDLKNLEKELNIENSVYWPGFSTNITEFYLNASVLLLPALSQSYRMVINEAKAHGLPIVAFNIDYEPYLQSGVITVDMLNYKAMAKKAIKLLKNYNYRTKKGEEAKSSLNNYLDNNGIVKIWNRLLKSIAINSDDYKKLQEEIEKKYYNEEKAKNDLEKHYNYAQQFNPNFRCHSFENMMNLSYINNIEECPG
jgi:glycosyltransferase involved in cell wall biosynthesis